MPFSWSSPMFRMNSSVGHPLRCCQIRFGRKKRSAIRAPSQGQTRASCLRSRVASSPATSPAPQNSIVCLLSRPIPATAPTTSQSLGRSYLIDRTMQ